MDNKQTKVLISALILIWAFIVAAAGYYAMGYLSDLPFHTRWLLGTIFSTPETAAIAVIAVLWKKKA